VVAATQSVYNATAQVIKGAAKTITSTVKDAVTNAGNAAKAIGKSASDLGKSIARHAPHIPWRDVLAVVITAASAVGVIVAASACIASVVCGVAAGIAIRVGIGIATGAALYVAENAGTSSFTANGLLTEAAIGGGIALIGAGVGAAAIKIIGAALSKWLPSAIKAVKLKTPENIRVGDVVLPGVPKGSVGRLADNGKGLIYDIPAGTPEIHPNVTSIRVMDPLTSGRYPSPNGRVAYMNVSGETITPLSGIRTKGNTDPMSHILLP
jgi:hypothetical protein